MSRQVFRASVSAAALILSAASGWAVLLDQYQTSQNGGAVIADGWSLGQTFTVGLGGRLSQIDMWIEVYGSPPAGDTSIAIHTTSSGTPTDTVLGSLSVPALANGWNSFDFSTQPIGLTLGNAYAIVATNNSPWWNQSNYRAWLVRWDPNAYASGALWKEESGGSWQPVTVFGGGGDAAFRTWMSESPVPEPTSCALLACAIAGVGVTLKRRRGR